MEYYIAVPESLSTPIKSLKDDRATLKVVSELAILKGAILSTVPELGNSDKYYKYSKIPIN